MLGFDPLGALPLGGIPVGGSPVEPAEPIFSPLDFELCFGNEKDLDLFGGETPSGIPAWVADPSAVPVTLAYAPLSVADYDVSETALENSPLEISPVGAGKSLRVYTE